MSERSEMIRKMFGEGDRKRDEGLTTPEDIQRFDDITYGTEGEHPQWQMLDVYRPKCCPVSEKLPVIISVHGGGWVYGDKDGYQWYCMNLAQRGFAVINFSYRLAPEYKFPCNEEDTNQVVAWMIAHAEEYGFDLNNVFAVGDSAGGSNLALYAAMTENKEYADMCGITVPEGFHFNAVGLNCPALSDHPTKRGQTTKEEWSDLFGDDVTDEDIKVMHVELYMNENYPPTFLLTSNQDFLRWDQPEMVAKMEELNIPFSYNFYGTKEAPLGHVFHCNIKTEAAKIANDAECAFFKAYLKK